MEKEINNVINEEVGIQTTSLGIRNQKCYAVKVFLSLYIFNLCIYLSFIQAGVNGLLDVGKDMLNRRATLFLLKKKKKCVYVARQTYKETTEDIYELASSYNETYGLSIKLSFSALNGFYLTLQESQVTKGNLPSEFINVVKKRKTLQFTTLELVSKVVISIERKYTFMYIYIYYVAAEK